MVGGVTKFFLCATLIIFLCSGGAQAGWFGPSNFDECILDRIKGTQSDLAARAIMRACRQQFPDKPAESTPIPQSCFAKITGNATVSGGRIYGNIYNGCRDWHINSLTVFIQGDKNISSLSRFEKYMAEADPGLRKLRYEYNIIKDISPLTNADFSASVNWPSSIAPYWGIASARGYKSEK
jgi:hypothetical protein